MSDRLNALLSDIDLARRKGDAETMRVLKFLQSKVERIVKEGADRPAADEDVIVAVSKYRKEVEETRDALVKGGRESGHLDHEIALVSKYLPQQLTDAELDAEIEKALEGVVRDRKAMGVVMKHLTGGFKGRYDAKAANTLVSSKLTA